MDWLKNIAPMLGTAMAGPLAGAAASFLADKLGASEKTVEAVNNLLHVAPMTPEQISGIRQAETEFKKFLEQNKIDMAKLELQNTQGARDLLNATRSRTPEVLSFVVTFGFFGVLGYMLGMEHKPSEPLLIMLGALGTSWAAIVNFWFGSTISSARKTEMLAQAEPLK